MELQQLKYFKAVADIGKISEAAKSLFVSALYPTTVTTKKPSTVSVEGLCSRYLSSRAVARQVLSAYMSLTSVFGMGTGGPS